MRSWVFLAGAAGSFVLLAPRPAPACSVLLEPTMSGEPVLPRPGSVAPQNTRIWVLQPIAESETSSHVCTDFSATVNGKSTAISDTRIAVTSPNASEGTAHMLQLPEALSAGAEVRLQCCITDANKVRTCVKELTHFSAGSTSETDAPSAPTLSPVHVEVGDTGCYTCGDPTLAQFTITDDTREAITFVGPAGTSLVSGLTTDPEIVFLEPRAGVYRQRVLRVGLSGLASPAVETEEYTVGSGGVSGCNVTGSGGSSGLLATLFATGLATIRARRRACRP